MKKPFKTRPKQITVEPFEYKATQRPNTLSSEKVGHFVVLGAIYDSKGYIFHMNPNDPNFLTHIKPLFMDLREDIESSSIGKRPQIYIIGGKIGIENPHKKDLLNKRKILLNEMKKNKFRRFIEEIRWCPTNHTQDLRLILSEGRAEIKEFSHIEEEIMAEGYPLNSEEDYSEKNYLGLKHKGKVEDEEAYKNTSTDGYHNAQGILVEQDFEE